jgi:uncharacterized repeat protein (TIGR03806 family)
MRRFIVCSLVLVLVGWISWMFNASIAWGDEKPNENSVTAAKYGTANRPLWTTSKVVGSPDPPAKYTVDVAFDRKFNEPLSFANVPGTNRIAIAQRDGKIYTFENDREGDSKKLLIDVGRLTYGVVFHPDYEKNREFFVTTIDTGEPSDTGSRVSRFTSDKSGLTAKISSEKILLNWPSGGHNGGCLRFGPDGYLYLATGDGSGIADQRKTGQDISDLLGSILRLDVNRAGKTTAYAIPNDNPFVDTPNARPEIYSYGHRQVWKYSFDKQGVLWAGEVGQDLWEMVYHVKRGGNYGWSIREGSHPFRPERPKGPTDFEKPIVEHPHHDFRSITGGFVYTGKRLPELKGFYVYADYDTGKIWALKWNRKQKKVVQQFELCDEQIRVVEFGQTPDGEIFLLDYAGGQLHELVHAPPPTKDAPPFPRKLSETGLFASTKDLTPITGVIPYDVNSPLWSDHAHKDRFIAIPGSEKVEYEAVLYPQGAPGAVPGWRFPDGTVLVKTFSLDMKVGDPSSRKRLETRLLHYKKMDGKDDAYGAQVWRGYTYLWNDEQTDATLIESKGLDRVYTIADPDAKNGIREQKWHFPSRTECTLCHTMSAKYVLGVNTAQMNREFDYGAGHGKKNQLDYLNEIGLFTKPLPETPAKLAKLSNYHDDSQSVDDRARSYLQSNCSHCHRKWGGGNAEFQLLNTLSLADTGTINERPGQGKFNLADPRILVPGDPDRSLLHFRMNKLGLGRMPHIASSIRDEKAVKLIRKWITEMK